MKPRLLSTAAVLTLALTTRDAVAQPTKLPVAAWRADIAYADSTMRLVHPSPFHRVSRATFADAFRLLNRDLPRLSDQQVAIRLIGISSLLNDGHSRLAAGASVFARDRVFPLRVERFADGIHVIATRPVDADISGARVLRVGALSASAAWDSLESFSAGDNRFSRMANVPFQLSNPEIMHGLGLTPAQELSLEVLTAKGDTIRRRLSAVAEPVNGNWLSTGWRGPGGATHSARGTHADASLVDGRRGLAYWYVERGKALYVQVNQIADSRDSVDLGNRRAVVTLAQFAQHVMDRIDAGGVDRLILDLRFNGGGNNALVRPFVSGISARPVVNARGRLFVITGRETYSAAMNFVSMLEDRTQALFVGEPPGGAPLHYGDAVAFTLPNSKLVLRVSTVTWNTGVPPTDVREVMEPDILAPPRFSDFHSGEDGPLRAIDAYGENTVLADALKSRYRAAGLDAALALADSARARGFADANSAPWNLHEQQFLEFAYAVIPIAKTRDDIFRAFGAATARFPQSHQAWYERGRVSAFVNDWPSVRASYERAKALRPNNDVIRRAAEAAKRR